MRVHHVHYVLLVLLILTSSIAFAVDVTPITKPPSKPSGTQTAWNWIKVNIWFVIIFMAIGMGIFVFALVWKKTISRIDPFFENWKKTKDLCKMNKRWSMKDVYRVSANSGLKWLGDYEGDCVLEDGSINVMWSNWKWGLAGKIIRIIFFPLRPLWKMVMKDFSILKAPYNEKEMIKVNHNDLKNIKLEKGESIVEVEVKTNEKDKKGNLITEKMILKKTNNPIDYVIFDQSGNVLIKAVSLSRTKNFYCPVISNKEGEVIDTRKEVFVKESGEALLDGLYNLTIDFANIMRERVGIEPKVRYIQKTEGTEVREE